MKKKQVINTVNALFCLRLLFVNLRYQPWKSDSVKEFFFSLSLKWMSKIKVIVNKLFWKWIKKRLRNQFSSIVRSRELLSAWNVAWYSSLFHSLGCLITNKTSMQLSIEFLSFESPTNCTLTHSLSSFSIRLNHFSLLPLLPFISSLMIRTIITKH